MDARNDDSSGGSDSLDKSLQRKCVVDDVGQGEGKQTENNDSGATVPVTMQNIEQNLDNCNRTQHNKTEKSVGDCNSGRGVGNGGGVSSGGSIAVGSSKIMATDEALIQHACDETKIEDGDLTTANSNHLASSSNSNTYNNNNINNVNHNNSSNNNNNAFETKVKQISKDLKETTLAEYTVTITESSVNTRTSASSSSTSTSLEAGSMLANSTNEQLDANGQICLGDSTDDSRSKKVRFHPDVKENDGGNPNYRKKKKNVKSHAGEDATTSAGSSQRTTSTDDEMDYEEEEEPAEEEEEFNLAKTIEEAQNYLKLHPLTFVRSNNNKNSVSVEESSDKKRLQNGLLQEEDLSLLSESSEDEDFNEEIEPECGIERILGKHIRDGKTQLLVRLVNDNGLYWESEDRITSMCPLMMINYELNRERRQERLMRHVAKRQNLRQRYTDF